MSRAALDGHAGDLGYPRATRPPPPLPPAGGRPRRLVEVTPEMVEEMRRMHLAGRSTREIGRAMDLSHQTVLRHTDETACEYARLAVERAAR